jgi:hypothetical protein
MEFNMKITRKQLKRIIKEELGRVSEGFADPPRKLAVKIEDLGTSAGDGKYEKVASDPSVWKYTVDPDEVYHYMMTPNGSWEWAQQNEDGSWEEMPKARMKTPRVGRGDPPDANAEADRRSREAHPNASLPDREKRP